MKTRILFFIILLINFSCKVKNKTLTTPKNLNALELSIEPYVWQAVGPFGSPIPYAVKGEWSAHGTGRFECIDVQPNNENEILAGHATSGLFKTTDGGITWQQKLNFEFATGIFDILRFRKNLNHLIACCATDIGIDKVYGYGLIESFDGGESWKRNSLQYNPSEYNLKQQRAIVIADRRSEQRLISISNHEIYLSKDGAKTWELVYKSKDNLQSVKVNPNDDQTIIVTGNVFLVSIDGGETWRDKTPALCLGYGSVPNAFARYEVCFSEKNKDQLWIAVSHNSSYLLQTDAGYFKEFKLICKGQFSANIYHMTIGLKANRKGENEQLYIGTTRLFRSTNEGVSFLQLTSPENATINNAHDDVNDFLSRPDGSLYIATDGGVDVSNDNGQTWRSITNYSVNLNGSLLFGFDRSESGIVLAGTQDKGIFVYPNDSWFSSNMYGDGGRVVAVNNNKGFACGYQKMCYKTMDAGKNFYSNHAGGDINFFDFRMIFSKKFNTLFIANQHLYKQSEGKNFEIISNELSTERAIGALWVNPDNDDEIWMSKMDATWGGPLIKKLYYSNDCGVNWQDRTSNLPILKWRSISDINVNTYGDIAIALSGFDNDKGELNKVYISTDGGETFENNSAGLENCPVNSILAVDNQWVCGTANSIYIKKRGEVWQKLGVDFPATIISEIKYFEKDNMLYVATFGRGLWRMWLK